MRVAQTVMDAILDLLLAVDGILDGAQLRLFINDIEEDAVEDAGDLEVPTFTTYADAALDAGTVSIDSEGKVYVNFDAVEFSPTAATNLPQMIRGAAILDDADDLVAVSKFDTPVGLTASGQVLTVLPKFRIVDKTDNNIIASVE